jgi:hypothetical protein
MINTLQEGKSLVEMITGHRHDDLEVVPTVQNCMRLYQRLVTLGTRWKPEYKIQLDIQKIEVDCAPAVDEIKQIGRERAHRGGEPDDCYIVGADQSKDRPDLVIEVIGTSGGIDKLARSSGSSG